ncbi:MAG: glycerophosphodiester phosphodiesterase family protein [Actinomycetota bacterium]|nr:glycerophosphodiester phosphodiesterase family protein [Actinomycetota bacterium]
MPAHPYLAEAPPVAIAHRGGALDAPQNSLAAFGRAVDLGYRYLETDCHLTRDGVLVAVHDDALDDIADRDGVIAELTFDEVREARLLDPDGEPSDERVPTLEELLVTWPETRFSIDPKSDDATEPLIVLLDRLGALDRVCVGSFSGTRLDRVREVFGPAACTALSPAEVAKLRAASFKVPVGGIGGLVASVPPSQKLGPGPEIPIVDERFVASADRFGIHIHVWTIDEAAEMERLLDLGAHGIMTDRPALLREVLERRGEWR